MGEESPPSTRAEQANTGSKVQVPSGRELCRGPFQTDCMMNCISVQQYEYLPLYRFWSMMKR
jgi:hypothetical protein